ncbi:MAG: hypothetical protein RJA57_1493 [Bacteroidota bacterium]|jgi:hypothetical protein
MKYGWLPFLLLLFRSLLLEAQSYEDLIQFEKRKQKAIAMHLGVPAEATETAFLEKMRQLGYKPKEEKGLFNSDKGFLIFRNAAIPAITRERLDYVVRIEPKKPRETEESTIWLILMKEAENAFYRLAAADIGKAKNFLLDLVPGAEAAYLEMQIRDQERSIENAEKKLRALDGERQELDRRLGENLQLQEQTLREIDSRKRSLETLRSKRKKD